MAADAALASTTEATRPLRTEEVQRMLAEAKATEVLKRMPITVPTGEGMSYRKG